MLFSRKKQPKLDPKVRFQNRQFNQKLQTARTFKRTTKPVADGKIDRYLSSIGLGSRVLQAGIVLLVLALGYVIYVPNFLSVQNIEIEGASEADSILIESAIRNEIGSAPFYNPQRNLLFTSKSLMSKATLSVPGVGNVNVVSKNFSTKSIYVHVTSKYEKFLVRTNDRVFDIYNDGVLKSEAGVTKDSWIGLQNPNMIKFDILGTVLTDAETREFFSDATVRYLSDLQDNIKGIIGSPLLYVRYSNTEIDTQQSLESEPEVGDEEVIANDNINTPESEEVVVGTETEITVPQEIALPLSPGQLDLIMQKGTDAKRTFRVIVDTKETPHDVVQRLNLLLSQTNPERYNAISYIDLRVKSRAYVCLINTVCD